MNNKLSVIASMLEKDGYKLEEPYTWIQKEDWYCRYIRKGSRYYLVTVGFATGMAVVEILKHHKVYRVEV